MASFGDVSFLNPKPGNLWSSRNQNKYLFITARLFCCHIKMLKSQNVKLKTLHFVVVGVGVDVGFGVGVDVDVGVGVGIIISVMVLSNVVV